MDLEVNGTIIKNATQDDIGRALKSRTPSRDWSITLDSGRGGYIQGFAEAGMQFRLTCRDKNKQCDGKELVDANELNRILASYLKGTRGWRGAIAWDHPAGDGDEFQLLGAAFEQIKLMRAGKSFRAPPGQLSPLTVLGAIAVIGLFFFGLWVLPSLEGVLSHLPWPFDTYVGQVALLVVLLPIGITYVVLQSKLGAIRRAASWPSAPARVITSEVRANRTDSTIKNPLFDNIPSVRYEFEVAGRKVVGDRISFGDDTGGANTEATLARYPVGRELVIYYNPVDPSDAVIEREVPEWLAGGCLRITLLALVAMAVIASMAAWAPGWITAHLPNARNPNLATMTGLMGLAALLMSYAYWRTNSRAASWPAVPGAISLSGVKEVRSTTGSGGNRQRVTSFEPSVEYTYKINDHSYVGRQIKLGMTASGSRASAEAVIARYPVGAAVEVHYDPANPGEAAIERSTSLPLAPLAVALALIAFALYMAGVF
jgi:hypothetical protein